MTRRQVDAVAWLGCCALAVVALDRALQSLVDASYRHGYASGRLSMLSSIREAKRREMSFADWLTAERERDGA